MASSKISELVDGGSFLPGDDTIIVRNGANFKVDPTKNAVQAWVNFNGTGTVAIRASYNVSSITDNGTGDYTVNFTNALTDANYTTPTSSALTATGTGGSQNGDIYVNDLTSSSYRIITSNNGTFTDMPIVTSIAVR